MVERVAVAEGNISDFTMGVGDGGRDVGDGGTYVGDGGENVGAGWQPATSSPASPMRSHSHRFAVMPYRLALYGISIRLCHRFIISPRIFTQSHELANLNP